MLKYYYYQIIPLTRISINRDPYFTYKSQEEVPFGSLVMIPFGPKKIKGIVFTKQRKPVFKTREILQLKTPSLVNKNQLKLAQKISDYYFTPLGVVFKFFTPYITKKIQPLPENTFSKKPKIRLTEAQKKALQKIIRTPQKKSLVFGPASSGKTEIAMSLIDKNLKNKKQALVILPEIFLSYQEICRYQERFFDKKVALLHSQLKPSEFSTIWRQVKSGELDILISTKIGCFMPFKNLGTIIVDEEQDISHKSWDQNPKYHVERITSWLIELHQSQLIFLSATPSIKNYWKSENKKDHWQLVNLPSLQLNRIKVVKPKIKILNLWEKSYQKNGDLLFSHELLADFKKTLLKKKVSLILVPYYGKSQAVLCENCKTTLKCPKCRTSLVHTKDNYHCLHCNYKTSSLTSCPSCKSYKLKNVGFGTESVASEIKKRFPYSKVASITRDNFEKNKSREILFEKIKEGKIDFLVGNQTIAKGFDFPNINLVAILNAQRWTGKADFKFDERWLGGFFQVGGRLNRPHSDQQGIFYIQTFKPNLEILEILKEWNWKKFTKEELLNRKTLGYPPFNKLYRLTFKDVNKEKVEKITNKVYNQLQESSEKNKIVVFEPFYSFIKKKGIFWNKHILIKTETNRENSRLEKVLRDLSASWSIDPDPENIF
ncbi:MAG: primosomal protein N' [Candidatus Moranbacteria bacterium]|nr:primosomal protein N' [Candidatus Moranbacteria bacterium]